MNKKGLNIKFIGEYEIINYFDLSSKQQEEIKDDYDSIEEKFFFVDKHNRIHDLNEYMITQSNDKLKSFHGYASTGFFHSYLIILNSSSDGVKLFDYYAN